MDDIYNTIYYLPIEHALKVWQKLSLWNIPVEGRHFSHFLRLFELLKTKNRSSYVVPGTHVRINYKKRTDPKIKKGKKILVKNRNFQNFRKISYIRFSLKTQVFEKFSGTYISNHCLFCQRIPPYTYYRTARITIKKLLHLSLNVFSNIDG